MGAFYKEAFRKFLKKQSRAFQLAVEDKVERILKEPEAGEAKKGDLAGYRVYKFMFQKQEYLIAFKLQNEDAIFYMIGPHENFYRELKRYIREVK